MTIIIIIDIIITSLLSSAATREQQPPTGTYPVKIPWCGIWSHLSITMFYHILPCLAMFSHVLPCFTIFYHVWPCLELMRKDWENEDDHVSDQNDICWGLDCNIQGYSSGLVRSMCSSTPCLTTVSSTMARGLRRRSSRPASKSSWWSIDVKMMWEDHDDENNGVIYCHAVEVLTSVFRSARTS